MKLSHLYSYPLKSGQPITHPSAQLYPRGIEHDRVLIVIDKNGEMVTGRTVPAITEIQVSIEGSRATLSTQSQTITVGLTGHTRQTVSVWGTEIDALLLSDANEFLLKQLGRGHRLCYFDEQATRQVKRFNSPVAFADGFPLLIIGSASLAELNRRSESVHQMLEFRPNIVIETQVPFIEDSWRRIKIGQCELEIVKPCSRCIFTTLDNQTGQYRANQEPLKSLATFRLGDDGQLYFGQNGLVNQAGRLSVGDKVEVLQSQTPPSYIDRQQTQAQVKVELEDGSHFAVSPDAPILSQALASGVLLPYSCGQGRCQQCLVQVLSGVVLQGPQQSLTLEEVDAGYRLICCSSAQTDCRLKPINPL